MWKSEGRAALNWVRGKERWLFLFFLGLILLLSGSWGVKTENREETSMKAVVSAAEPLSEPVFEKVSTGSGKMRDVSLSYEKELEERVRTILSHVEGVGKVEVMILLKTMGETVFHTDRESNCSRTEEKDSAGGTRSVMSEEKRESVRFYEGSKEQTPVISKELRPEIEGIIISAQGGGSALVQTEISEAMEALFGLPAHKIKVLKREE